MDLPAWLHERLPAVEAALEAAGGDVRYTELLGVDHNSWDAAYGSVELVTWLFDQRRDR